MGSSFSSSSSTTALCVSAPNRSIESPRACARSDGLERVLEAP